MDLLERCYAPPVSEAGAIPDGVQRVVLAGFMGSGKTAVGRELATQLGWQFLDLDDEVTRREGRTVPEIFAQRGEAAFRQAEFVALGELLQSQGAVIALGGGAPETEDVRRLLATDPATVVVHLHAPFDVLYDRCLVQAGDPAATVRPLLGARQAAALRYERRLTLYAQVAHHTADAAAGSPAAVAGDILDRLRQRL